MSPEQLFSLANAIAARASRRVSVSTSFSASIAQASAVPGSRPNTLP